MMKLIAKLIRKNFKKSNQEYRTIDINTKDHPNKKLAMKKIIRFLVHTKPLTKTIIYLGP